MRAVAGVFAAVVVLACTGTASAAVQKVRVAGGFVRPVQVDAPRGVLGSTLFVAEQPGRVIRWKNGRRNVFLDLRSRVLYGGERGLLSIAFANRFQATGYFFVFYTALTGDLVVERYRANSTRTRGLLRTRTRLLTVRHRTYANHNGGTLRIGPDSYLYVSTGDGGGACDPPENAQNVSSRLGKLLRLGGKATRMRGYGLRNPWRFSFDRATGDLYIGDVGQNDREEIDYLPRAQLGTPAENWGWDVREGSLASGCENTGLKGSGPLRGPIFDYGRATGFTVIGGFVSRGPAMPAQAGRYFFGDLGGRIMSFVVSGGVRGAVRTEGFTIPQLSSFGENSAGNLYAVSLDGTLWSLVDR